MACDVASGGHSCNVCAGAAGRVSLLGPAHVGQDRSIPIRWLAGPRRQQLAVGFQHRRDPANGNPRVRGSQQRGADSELREPRSDWRRSGARPLTTTTGTRNRERSDSQRRPPSSSRWQLPWSAARGRATALPQRLRLSSFGPATDARLRRRTEDPPPLFLARVAAARAPTFA